MRVLLDTHVLIWWFLDSPRLPEKIKALIDEPESTVLVSAASGWEIATKFRIGKFQDARELAQNFPDHVKRWRFAPLSITLEHAHLAGLLPGAHRDPFDRMLAAQSILEGVELVSSDPAVAQLGARVVW